MSKILIIGVGGGGRNTVQRMKEIGIPDANYITFGGFREDYVNGEFKQALPNSDIPHYNLVKMNGYIGIPYTTKSDKWAKLAENVKDKIKAVLETSFNKDANGLISKDAAVSIDGLYLIECAGDNHSFSELYKYRKGERLWKYFEGEYEHANGWSTVKPINITSIVLEADTKWKQGEIAPSYGLYIVAYTFQNGTEAHYGYHASYGTTETVLNMQYDKKNYAIVYANQDDNFIDILVKSHVANSNDNDINWENTKVLSYYIVHDDTDLIKTEYDIQELEQEIVNRKKGLFSKIIHFIERIIPFLNSAVFFLVR